MDAMKIVGCHSSAVGVLVAKASGPELLQLRLW